MNHIMQRGQSGFATMFVYNIAYVEIIYKRPHNLRSAIIPRHLLHDCLQIIFMVNIIVDTIALKSFVGIDHRNIQHNRFSVSL